MAQGVFVNCTIIEHATMDGHRYGNPAVNIEVEDIQEEDKTWITPSLPVAANTESKSYRIFDFLIFAGHSKVEMEKVQERLRIRCGMNNARALVRVLAELENEGYLRLSDARGPQEVHQSLCAAYPCSIPLTAFRQAWKDR